MTVVTAWTWKWWETTVEWVVVSVFESTIMIIIIISMTMLLTSSESRWWWHRSMQYCWSYMCKCRGCASDVVEEWDSSDSLIFSISNNILSAYVCRPADSRTSMQQREKNPTMMACSSRTLLGVSEVANIVNRCVVGTSRMTVEQQHTSLCMSGGVASFKKFLWVNSNAVVSKSSSEVRMVGAAATSVERKKNELELVEQHQFCVSMNEWAMGFGVVFPLHSAVSG